MKRFVRLNIVAGAWLAAAGVVLAGTGVALAAEGGAAGVAGAVDEVRDPGLPGDLAVGSVARDVPVTGGGMLDVDVYFPEGDEPGVVDPEACPCPVVVFGHGFSRNRSRYSDLGEHLASRGFVVVLPQFRCSIFGCDHDRAGNDMVAVIDWMLAEDADPGSIFFERIDEGAIGTSGHSAGGLWSLLAAARDPRVDASAPMDPVDNGGLGVGEIAGARGALALTWSEPSSCNADGSSEDLYAAAADQKRGVKLVGANHCDPEKDGDFFGCELTCGRWSAERHERYLRYVTGWMEYTLHCDAGYKPWALGQRVEQDLAAGLVTYDGALAPPAPTGVSAGQVGAAVEVTRDPPDRCAPLDGWRVYRAPDPLGPYELVADGLPASQLTWVDDAVASNTEYAYVARDVVSDFVQVYESADSNAASVTTGAPTPGEASDAASGAAPLQVARAAGGPGSTALELTYDPAPCATDHVAYWVTTPATLTAPPDWSGQACALGDSGTAIVDPGALAPGSALLLVIVGNDGAVEGSYGRNAPAASERPEATGLPECDYPQSLTPGCF